MTNPIQPLSPHFVRSTFYAFFRFAALHPLIVCGTLFLQFASIASFYASFSSFPVLLQVGTPLMLTLQHICFVLALSPLAFEFLQTQKSTETTSNAVPLLQALQSFVKEAWAADSHLGWPTHAKTLSICLAIVFALAYFGIIPMPPLTTPETDAIAPPIIFWTLHTRLQTALGVPLSWLILGYLLIPFNQFFHLLSSLHPRELLKIIPHYMMTATMLNAEQSSAVASRIVEANTQTILLKLLIVWLIARCVATPFGLAALLDAFAFAALLHASLGGTLNPAPAPSTVHKTSPQLTAGLT